MPIPRPPGDEAWDGGPENESGILRTFDGHVATTLYYAEDNGRIHRNVKRSFEESDIGRDNYGLDHWEDA